MACTQNDTRSPNPTEGDAVAFVVDDVAVLHAGLLARQQGVTTAVVGVARAPLREIDRRAIEPGCAQSI